MKLNPNFKKKNLIPVCRIRTNDDFNKENIFIHKVPKGKTSLALSKREFGNDLTNILQKKNMNMFNISIQNPSKTNSLSKIDINLKKNISFKNLLPNSLGKNDLLLPKNNSGKFKLDNNNEGNKAKFLYKKKQGLNHQFSFHFLPTNGNNKQTISTSTSKHSLISTSKRMTLSGRQSLSKKKEVIVSKEKDLKDKPLNSNDKRSPAVIKVNLFPVFKEIGDIQNVPEYCDEIYDNLLKEEQNFIVSKQLNSLYMKNQTEINAEMRAILVNWIIEVHEKFKYKESTLFLCIMLIDRYLSKNVIKRVNFQLVGIASLYISCKHEEVNLPNPRDFLFITENAYSFEELYQMEYDILKTVNFEVLVPNSLEFFLLLSKKYNLTTKEDFFGKYLITSVLLDYGLIKYPQSLISKAALSIILKNGNKEGSKIDKLYLLNENNEQYDIRDCMKDIAFLIEKLGVSEYVSAKNKYGKEKYENASSIKNIIT